MPGLLRGRVGTEGDLQGGVLAVLHPDFALGRVLENLGRSADLDPDGLGLDGPLLAVDGVHGFADKFSLVIVSHVLNDEGLLRAPDEHFLRRHLLKPLVAGRGIPFRLAGQHGLLFHLSRHNARGPDRKDRGSICL